MGTLAMEATMAHIQTMVTEVLSIKWSQRLALFESIFIFLPSTLVGFLLGGVVVIASLKSGEEYLLGVLAFISLTSLVCGWILMIAFLLGGPTLLKKQGFFFVFFFFYWRNCLCNRGYCINF
ncbi:MAG: hypothetical protein HC808_18560 [Candidatus Competibacteraceae bacterium]|nr:hypothetical protein [Candidatus Competibacteraceae bacterium]